MFLVFLFLALSSLLISRVLYRSYLSPIGIFGLIWNGALALFEARLIDYYPLSREAYVAFVGSFLLFVWGVHISTWPLVKWMRQAPRAAYMSSFGAGLDSGRTQRVLDILNLLSLVGLTLTAIRLVQLVGWGSLFDVNLVMEARRNLGATEKLGGGIVGYLSSMVPLTAILAGAYLVQSPSDWFRACLCLFIAMVGTALSGSRASFIRASVLFFAAYILTRAFVNRESFNRVIRLLSLGIAVLFVVFASIGSRRFDTAQHDAFFPNVELPWPIMHTYHYITAGLGAFSVHLDNPVCISIPGLHTLPPVVRMLARIDPSLVGGYSYATLLQHTVRRESVATPVRTNVYTYLGQVFDDFGWWGVFLVPLGMGVLSGFVFQRLLVRPSLVAVALYSFLCLQFVYSSVAFVVTNNAILISVLALAVVQRRVSATRRRECSSLPFATSATGMPKQ